MVVRHLQWPVAAQGARPAAARCALLHTRHVAAHWALQGASLGVGCVARAAAPKTWRQLAALATALCRQQRIIWLPQASQRPPGASVLIAQQQQQQQLVQQAVAVLELLEHLLWLQRGGARGGASCSLLCCCCSALPTSR
jgi:hypothetical protein